MLTRQQLLSQRLERLLVAFFLLAALFLVVVYLAAPSVYARTLLLAPSSAARYPLPVTLFLVAILVVIAIVITGVVRHWRWLYWLLLVAAARDDSGDSGDDPPTDRCGAEPLPTLVQSVPDGRRRGGGRYSSVDVLDLSALWAMGPGEKGFIQRAWQRSRGSSNRRRPGGEA